MQVSKDFRFCGGQLDEDALIQCCSLSDTCKEKFRYFVVDNSFILAVLEELQGSEDSQYGPPAPVAAPALAVLIRGPARCHAWTLQLHLQPRDGRAHIQVTSNIKQLVIFHRP